MRILGVLQAPQAANRMTGLRLLLPIICALTAATGAAEVNVTLDEATINAEGLTANDHAIVFGLARTVINSATATVQETQVVDTDTFGDAEHETDHGSARRSVWFVVDFATGEYASATAPGMTVEELVRPDGGPINLGQLISGRLIADLSVVDLLFVRPGTGAWSAHIGDGGPGDTDDERDGVLNIRLSAMRSLIDGVAPPSHIQGGDVIVLVNTKTFAHTVAAIGN